MSSKILLYDGPPLVVSPSLIQRVGMNEAFVLQQVHYWINPSFNKNVFEEKHWVRNTYQQWQKQFPFWTVKRIRSIFTLLQKRNILLSFTTFHNFQKIKYYTLNYEELERLEMNEAPSQEMLDFPRCAQNGLMDVSKSAHACAQNELIDAPDFDGNLKNRVEKSEKLQENSGSFPWAQNGLMHGPEKGSPWAQNGYIHEPKMGSSYIDTEITYRDIISPLSSPLKNSNFEKKVLSEEEKKFKKQKKIEREEKTPKKEEERRFKKIQDGKEIKNLREAGTSEPFVESSNLKLELEPKNDFREFSEEESNISEDFEEIRPEILDETSQKMRKVWNEEVQQKLKGCLSEILLIAERSQRLNFFLTEFLKNDFEAWRSYCQKISQYRFLMGESKSGFRVTFDWAIKPKNALKVLEGVIFDRPHAEKENEERLVQKPWVEYTQSLKEYCASRHYPESWFDFCKFLSRRLGQATFENWFKKIEPSFKDDHTLWIITETAFLRDYITTHYRDFLNAAIQKAFPKVTEFKIQADAQQSKSLQILTVPPLCRTSLRQSIGKAPRADTQGDAFVSTRTDPGREAPESDSSKQEGQK